jgi:glycosyltransferase involved in cell wall biosynthesis
MSEPLVSVKMITYNHAPYIAQAIEGVLMQKTSFRFELVIGEDCSTDGTREIVFDYKKRYPEIIRVITSEKNVGARKNSLRTDEACKGKYIALCEGDDYWLRVDKLQMQVDYLEEHEEVGLVHSEINLINLFQGTTINRYHESKNAVNVEQEVSDLSYEILLGRYLVRTCTVCMRKDLSQKIKDGNPEIFRTERFILGDTPFWLEMSKITGFHYIDETLAAYRKHKGGVSGLEDSFKYVNFEISVLDMLVYYIEKFQYADKVLAKYLDIKTNNILGFTFDNMDSKLAQRARKIRGKLSPKLMILYWGSTNKLANLLFAPFVQMKRSCKRC